MRDFEPHDTVGIVILNSKSEILVMYHNKIGKWSLPVGKTEEGEDPKDAIIREMKEELGITVCPKLLKNKEMEYSLDGKSMTSMFYLFMAESYDGNIDNIESDKHREIKFMSPDELYINGIKKNISEMTKLLLDDNITMNMIIASHYNKK